MVDMTYVALKPLRIGGQRREPGELVPEAATWPRVSAWVDTGRITVVAKSAVDPDALKAAEDAFAERVRIKQEADKSAEGETQEVEKTADDSEQQEAPVEDEGGDHDVETFASGNGWYEIPGVDKKMRRDEAIAHLAALEDDEE